MQSGAVIGDLLSFPFFPSFSLPVLSLGTSATLHQCMKDPMLICGAHAWEAVGLLCRSPGAHQPWPSSSRALPSPAPPVHPPPCQHFRAFVTVLRSKQGTWEGKEQLFCLLGLGASTPLTHTHTHTGSLHLTNNYLTKYANSIITVICLAVISVWNVNVNFGIFAGYVCAAVGLSLSLSLSCVFSLDYNLMNFSSS